MKLIILYNFYFFFLNFLSDAPCLSVYTASKSFNYSFSRSLYTELNPRGFDICAYTPAVVESNLSKQKVSLTVADPLKAAKAALGSIHLRQSAGTAIHSLQWALTSSLPIPLLEMGSRDAMRKIIIEESKLNFIPNENEIEKINEENEEISKNSNSSMNHSNSLSKKKIINNPVLTDSLIHE